MATAGDRHGHSRAEAEWQQALELEKKLKATYRKRSFYDPEARTLRNQLRNTYESLLFLDAAFAAANDVELALWRSVFYRPIEEFRSRLKQAEKAGEVGAAQLPKVAAAFVKFLEDAALFYRRLVMQLQAVYGDVGVKLDVPREAMGAVAGRTAGVTNGSVGMHSSTSSSAPRDVRPGVHRCLIYLGDLSRYTAQASPKAAAPPAAQQQQPAARPDWLKAAHYYRLAARVLPRSGNPHNQLAVMAVMTGDELRAVYHYARSLCVGIPFQTAKENLMLLFEQNRQRYNDYAQREKQQQQQRQLPPAQLLSDLSVCYVRLSGLFFDKINQHEYPAISTNAAAALAALTGHQSLLEIMQRQPRADCTPLHLIVLSIFAVHNCSAPVAAEGRAAAAAAAALGYGDAAQRGQQRSRALAMVYKTGRLLCQAAAAACNSVVASAAAAAAAAQSDSAKGSAAAAGQEWKGVACLLVAVNVLFHWLAAQPVFSGLQVATATEDEAKARATFWSAAAQCITAVAAAYPSSSKTAAAGRLSAAAAAAGIQQGNGSAGGDSCEGGALPEELELLGFEPLRSKHYFHVTDVGKLAVDEPATRTCRMLAAARAVSGHLAGPEQQQVMRHHAAAASSEVQPQTMRQLAVGVQQFVSAVAEVTAGPGTVGTAGRLELMEHAAAAATEVGGVGTSMEVDIQQQQQPAQQPPAQQQQQDDHMEDEGDEEVIVFQPRLNRLSTISDDAATAAAATAALAGSAPAAGPAVATAAAAAAAGTALVHNSPKPATLPVRAPPPSAVAAAAAEPPPLPQQLLASRQQGRVSGSSSQAPSGVSSPAGAASPQRVASHTHAAQQQQQHVLQQQQQQQHNNDTGLEAMITSPVNSTAAGQISPSVAAAAAGSTGAAAATGLLHGHAATALDLQQGQAASDALLARLTARQGGGLATSGLATGSGPLGLSGLGPGALGGSGGLGLSSNLPPAPGYWSSGGASGGSGGFSRTAGAGAAAAAAGGSGRASPGMGNLNGTSGSAAAAAALRSQPPSPAVFGGGAAAAAAAGMGGSPRVGLGLLPGQQQQQQQFGGIPSGAFTGTGVQHSRGPSMDTDMGLNAGLGLGIGQQHPTDGFEGFDPLGFGLNSALNSQTFAGGGDSAVGGIAFDDQLLLGLGGGLAETARPISISSQQQQQQDQLHCSASLQLEQTARAAADSILSPEHKQGPALLQRHQQQRQQQQYQASMTAQQALAEAAAAAATADAIAAQALAAATGLTAARKVEPLNLQQQHVLIGGMYSPTAQQAITNARCDSYTLQQQSSLGRLSANPADLAAAAAAGGSSSIPSSPSILAAAARGATGATDRVGGYTMFSGPDLFAAADVAGLSAAALEDRQRRISSSSMAGSHSSHQGIAPVLRPLPPAIEQQMQLQQQQHLHNQGLQLQPLALANPGRYNPLQQQQQGEGLGACHSPTSPDGLTLLDYLADQQRKSQFGAGSNALPGFNGQSGFTQNGQNGQPPAGFSSDLNLGTGLGSGSLFAAGAPEVLLPPVDVVQSQNPFAS